ncbi:DNA internalization-related competence protein ComEC/Rec2 [Pusillimonas sp. 7-48]|uniref:DNA internalization-related competence protein ComEC/Rec2 n=2 Tax=Pusillimonas minor TaxID=2697024 RepID=A0A842HRW0_9BURK|nr:DNA internalization-related competence protein ComEC/Rec2 [Pusillimonas minor]
MKGRLCALAVLGGTAAVHVLPRMPTVVEWGAVALMVLMVGRAVPAKWRWLLFVLWAGILTFGMTAARIEYRLGDRLAATNENKVSRVVLRVAGLPKLSPDSRQFEAEVLSSRPEGVPKHIMVTWNAPGYAGVYGRRNTPPADFPDLVPGQVWRMALTLKSPSGARNPSAFDYEAYVFSHGIRALGAVRGRPAYMRDDGWVGIGGSAQRARHYVREAMRPYIEGLRYGGVLLALTIGDQASIGPADWATYNRAGLTHLISISGSHITMIAAIGGLLVLALWRRAHWRGRGLAERVPAQVAAAVAALIVAWLYCLLAGWGVPARRTFLMLAVVAATQILRVPLSMSRLLALVAVIVVVLDPWALFASGFWLSFGAVYVLMASAQWWGRHAAGHRPGRRASIWFAVYMAVGLQLAITAGLMPLLALIFNDVSLVSPLVNAYAIPVVSFIVTPVSLLAGAAAIVPGLGDVARLLVWVAHGAMTLMMVPTEALAQWSWASFSVASGPATLTALAVAGLLIAIAPYGLPLRSLGWVFMAPALFWLPVRPAPGHWKLVALDVGQGSALVIKTATRTLVFDTGVRHGPDADEGARTLLPYLRSSGVRSVDVLVVSHADTDHAGGALSLLKAISVGQSYTSFALEKDIAKSQRLLGDTQAVTLPDAMTTCAYGATWNVDGVTFSFLWPLPEPQPERQRAASGTPRPSSDKSVRSTSGQRNRNACVLRVQGQHHSVLLTGDIGAAEERRLLARGLGPTDVVVAAHHGSRFSSSQAFVQATQPTHVISQNGWQNRYGHPAPAVQQRWEASGAHFWRTDWHGALTVDSTAAGLRVTAERVQHRRYWQRNVAFTK